MTDDDWVLALQVFAACQSRRGDKGRDDRLFLEAMYFFTVENVSWRERRVRGLLRGLGRAERERPSRADVRLHRGARACLSRRRKRGQEGQALGRSRGGFSTKIHLKSDHDGRKTARDKPKFFPRVLYKGRARIEQTMGKLKRFKRVALRCEKTAKNYRSIIAFAAGLTLLKSVHTA